MIIKNIVDIHTIKTFTDKHLEISKQLVNEQTNPDLFGKHFKFGEDKGRSLVPIKDVSWLTTSRFSQYSRASGGNPKYKEIKNDILEHGYKLNKEPIALWHKAGALYPLTGHTRKEILSEYNMTNIIANVYTMNENNASLCGLVFNRPEEPKAPFTMIDVQNEIKHAIDEGWIKHTGDDDKFRKDINDRIDMICGPTGFTDNKKNYIVFAILNQYNDKKKGAKEIIAWLNSTAIKLWMDQNNYIDTDEVIYMVTSFSQVSKAIFRAAELSIENSDKEIRVVAHTGVLDGYDLKKCFDERVSDFRELWYDKLTAVRSSYFNNTPLRTDKILLWGYLPAMEEYHNTKKIIKYKKPSTIVNGD